MSCTASLSRLLHVVKYWQTKHFVCVYIIFPQCLHPRFDLTDSVRLNLCVLLKHAFSILPEQETSHESTRRKFRKHWLRQHLPLHDTRIQRCPSDRRIVFFLDTGISSRGLLVHSSRFVLFPSILILEDEWFFLNSDGEHLATRKFG